MATLLITDDELALLRYTCDVFFTLESPVYYIEQQARDPRDFSASYRSLLEKRVVDPRSFRLTDAALNRLAPVTECDARVLVSSDHGDHTEMRDYYLLDEIGVSYMESTKGHLIGADLDHEQMIEHFAQEFAPRRSRGDFVEVELTPSEYLVFALLAQDVRGHGPEQRLSLAEILSALNDLGFEAQERQAAVEAQQSRMPPYAVRTGLGPRVDPSAFDEEDTTAVDERVVAELQGLPADPLWEGHLDTLQRKGVLQRDPGGEPVLRPAFHDLARGLSERGRTSFVRFDFVDEDWLIRETSFLPVSGGLYFLGPTPEGRIAIRELDAKRLEQALRAAVGPLPPAQEAPASSRKARDFILRA